jgi:hypothetical protein
MIAHSAIELSAIGLRKFSIRRRDHSPPKHRPAGTQHGIQFNLLTLVVSGFSLISWCTHRAHAGF